MLRKCPSFVADNLPLHQQRNHLIPDHIALRRSHFPQILIGLHREPVFSGGAEEASDGLRQLRL